MTTRGPGALHIGALLATTILATPALAQDYAPPAPPPIRETIDSNGVDLARGTLIGRTHQVSIGGPGRAGLSWSRTVTGMGPRDSTALIVSVSGSTYSVSLGDHSESFTLSGANFVSDQKTGATLTKSGATYTYTARDGTVVTFGPWSALLRQYAGDARATSITYPTGETLTFNWEVVPDVCVPKFNDPCYLTVDGERLDSAEATNGYALTFAYQAENPTQFDPEDAWANVVKVTARNMSADPASRTWPSLSMFNDDWFTDALGRTTRYTFASGYLTGIKLPGSSADDVTITYLGGKVSKVVNEGVATNYSYADSGNLRSTTISDEAPGNRVVTTDLATMLVQSDRDEAQETTTYEYDPNGLLTKVTAPEGNAATFAYDERGNRTSTTLTPKSGSGSIVTARPTPRALPPRARARRKPPATGHSPLPTPRATSPTTAGTSRPVFRRR